MSDPKLFAFMVVCHILVPLALLSYQKKSKLRSQALHGCVSITTVMLTNIVALILTEFFDSFSYAFFNESYIYICLIAPATLLTSWKIESKVELKNVKLQLFISTSLATFSVYYVFSSIYSYNISELFTHNRAAMVIMTIILAGYILHDISNQDEISI